MDTLRHGPDAGIVYAKTIGISCIPLTNDISTNAWTPLYRQINTNDCEHKANQVTSKNNVVGRARLRDTPKNHHYHHVRKLSRTWACSEKYFKRALNWDSYFLHIRKKYMNIKYTTILEELWSIMQINWDKLIALYKRKEF